MFGEVSIDFVAIPNRDTVAQFEGLREAAFVNPTPYCRCCYRQHPYLILVGSKIGHAK